VVCGKGTGCRNGVDEAVADVSERHEVRCCKDGRTSVFKTNKCEGVWAASELGGSCHREKTYDEAKGICEEYDSRLCTMDELSRGCTKGSGCSMDPHLIWSGTPVASDPVSPSPSNAPIDSSPTVKSEYYVVCGKGTGCRNGVDEAVADVSERHEVRCCKDERTPVFKTNRCEDVYAASTLGGLCHPEKTYVEAKGICEEYASRLCTMDELSRGCTKGSGCGMDGHLIWSGTFVE